MKLYIQSKYGVKFIKVQSRNKKPSHNVWNGKNPLMAPSNSMLTQFETFF